MSPGLASSFGIVPGSRRDPPERVMLMLIAVTHAGWLFFVRAQDERSLATKAHIEITLSVVFESSSVGHTEPVCPRSSAPKHLDKDRE